jgi:hypothetical protein
MSDEPQKLKTRAESIAALEPQVIAEVYLYASEQGGRRFPVNAGWGCPCMTSREQPLAGYDGYPQLGDLPLEPGSRRKVGFVFLTDEGAHVMRAAETFYLWEGGFVGEAKVLR